MSKIFVVMPSYPENQININPGFGEFRLSSGIGVEYYYNVVLSTFEFNLPNEFPSQDQLSPVLNVRDMDEMIEFLTVVRDHMKQINGV